ncbi:uncharacterized protein [Drosophila kikkawai]|uniref:Regulatory protein zeste n=1 Tax=Drosophila kikkawai TaxID=30033 RepID=A0ABM4GG39_DROKI
MFTKRARGKNFTDSEEHILLDLLNQHNTVLQNKKSDAVTWQKKKETWERIAEEFADQTGVSRPWTALRDKYDNMKRKSRNGIEPGRRKTYGDTPSFSGSSVSEKVGNLMGITGAARLVNQFDSDANYQLVNEAEEGSEEASSTHNSESPHLVKVCFLSQQSRITRIQRSKFRKPRARRHFKYGIKKDLERASPPYCRITEGNPVSRRRRSNWLSCNRNITEMRIPELLRSTNMR